jgi:tetratricopeptide (TPR) repeat protein
MTTGQDAPLFSQAIAHFRAGRRPEAAALCRRILTSSPSDVHALEMLGMIEGMTGNAAESRALLERANGLRPRHPPLLNSLAIACQNTGDYDAAIGHCGEAIRTDPEFAAGWYTLAVNQSRVGDSEGALYSYRKVTELQPDNTDAWANRADLKERLNDLDGAASDATRALELAPDNVMANLVAARVDLRRGDAPGCMSRMRALLDRGGLSANHEAIARQRLGLALDQLDEPVAAFEEFRQANAVMSRDYEAAFQMDGGPYSLAAVRHIREFIAAEGYRDWPAIAAPADPHRPVFLMGFPRSGTTLIERMLDSLDSISTLEERETLMDLHRDFVLPRGGLSRLAEMTAASRDTYRQAYRRRVSDWTDSAPGVSLIDKLPLNSIFLPLIHRVFPDAAIIYVIRDPRDVCLSCYMQNFTLNEAMAHFLDLELTTEYYVEVMETGLAALDQLPINAHRIRYEDLIREPLKVARGLLDFLGRDWDPAVLEFHTRQRGKRIETPSYQQVSKPLYDAAIGRWRRYAELMRPHLEKLAPLAERLGYDP